MNHARPIDILLVEDDAGDVAYTREVFAEYRLRNRLTVLNDGLRALAYLRRQPPYTEATRPDLILLDLNLPGLDGRTVLDAIRADPDLADLPVVVLTASLVEEQILRTYGVPTEHYIFKPVDFDRLIHVVRRIDAFHIEVGRAR